LTALPVHKGNSKRNDPNSTDWNYRTINKATLTPTPHPCLPVKVTIRHLTPPGPAANQRLGAKLL